MTRPRVNRDLRSAERGIMRTLDALRVVRDKRPDLIDALVDEHRPANVIEAVDWIGVGLIRVQEDESDDR